MTVSGGCQCGAVRFSVDSDALTPAALCHCRMCQKQFSSPFAALVSVPEAAVRWTKGSPSHFQSSARARRGFCNQCGSPLTWEGNPGEIELAVLAFDSPSALPPEHQSSRDTRVAWIDNLAQVPWQVSAFESAGIVSFQHPDADD